jgi:hypothetical protein
MRRVRLISSTSARLYRNYKVAISLSIRIADGQARRRRRSPNCSPRPHPQWLERPAPSRKRAARAVRPGEVRPDGGQHHPGPLLFRAELPRPRPSWRRCRRARTAPKILQAPVTVIVGYDLDFPETLTSCSPTPRAPRTGSATPWPRSGARCATARCRAAISSWRRGPWAWTSVRCRASTTPASTPSSSRDQHQVQLHRLDRLRHRRGPVPAQSAPGLRGSGEDRLI